MTAQLAFIEVPIKARVTADRDPFDYYVTPPELIKAALGLLEGVNPSSVLDAGAGCGGWGAVARSLWPAAHITGVELRSVPQPPAYDVWVTGDALAVPLPTADLVVSNPPFRLAEPFLRRIIPLAPVTLAVVPFAFFGAQCRRAFWQAFPPAVVSLLRPRPSFTGNGTDPRDTAIFVWQRDYSGPAQLTHLDWR
jgi:hypothetical protein